MRSESEREMMAGRIAAEFVSFEIAAREMEGGGAGSYLPLEAFLLHAHKLREFFLGDDAGQADGAGPEPVRAEHFLEDPSEWVRARSGLSSEWLRKTRAAMDEELSAIRWESEDRGRMRWGEWMRAAPSIHAEMRAHWDRFLYTADAATANWFIKGCERHRGLQSGRDVRERRE